jgi:maleate cis-trans isomerase
MKRIKCTILLVLLSYLGNFQSVQAMTSKDIGQLISSAVVPLVLFGCGYAGHILRQRYHKRESDAEKQQNRGMSIIINAAAPGCVVIHSANALDVVQSSVNTPVIGAAAAQLDVVADDTVQPITQVTASVQMQEIKPHVGDVQPATLDANSMV